MTSLKLPSIISNSISVDAERSENMMADNRRNINWIEGVRGIASFLVVVTHLSRAFDYALFWPRDNENTPPRLLQLPILRIPFQGRIGVMMFAFLTGYVCAIKPLRQMKSGDAPGALVTLAKSAFRRPPRLVLPATLSLIISWLIAQMNGFQIATHCDSEWIRASSVKTEPTLEQEIRRFPIEWRKMWLTGPDAAYDEHTWALEPLLRGAMMVYLVLAATAFMKNSARTATVLLLWAWYWTSHAWKAETFETMLLWGVLLCDLDSSDPVKNSLARHPRSRRLAQAFLITAGLWAGSYPEGYPERSLWSQQLDTLNPYLFPSDSDLPKRWSSIAWHLISVGIWLSPTLKTILSNKVFTWLGRNSFAVYLTHGTLLRVVLVKLVYGMNNTRFWVEHVDGGEDIQHWIPRSQSWIAWYLAVLVWFVIVYVVATLWTTHVDGWCARATRALEQSTFRTERHEETNSKGLLG